jgi:hypothetical protein
MYRYIYVRVYVYIFVYILPFQYIYIYIYKRKMETVIDVCCVSKRAHLWLRECRVYSSPLERYFFPFHSTSIITPHTHQKSLYFCRFAFIFAFLPLFLLTLHLFYHFSVNFPFIYLFFFALSSFSLPPFSYFLIKWYLSVNIHHVLGGGHIFQHTQPWICIW